MAKRIIWDSEARSDVRKIEQTTALRVLNALARLIATSEGDVKRLQGVSPPQYRLRVGDYRVLYCDLGDAIRILAVKHRREVYR